MVGRRIAAGLLGVALMVATASSASARVTAAVFGCAPTFATLSSNGLVDQRIARSEDVTASPWSDFVTQQSGVRTMSTQSATHLTNSDRWYFRSFMVKDNALAHVMTSYPNSDPSRRTTSVRLFGTGWSGMTRIVDATDRGTSVTKNGYLYGLNPTSGTLSRYRIVEGSHFGDISIKSAGRATGYGAFRGLTLMHRYRAGYAGAADVLYATTASGALYQITIANTTAYAPKLTLVRASTWTFDQIAAVQCGTKQALVGIRTGSDQAFLYRVDSYKGTASTIKSFGQIRTRWTATHTAGAWNGMSGPSRW